MFNDVTTRSITWSVRMRPLVPPVNHFSWYLWLPLLPQSTLWTTIKILKIIAKCHVLPLDKVSLHHTNWKWFIWDIEMSISLLWKYRVAAHEIHIFCSSLHILSMKTVSYSHQMEKWKQMPKCAMCVCVYIISIIYK